MPASKSCLSGLPRGRRGTAWRLVRPGQCRPGQSHQWDSIGLNVRIGTFLVYSQNLPEDRNSCLKWQKKRQWVPFRGLLFLWRGNEAGAGAHMEIFPIAFALCYGQLLAALWPYFSFHLFYLKYLTHSFLVQNRPSKVLLLFIRPICISFIWRCSNNSTPHVSLEF